MITLDGVEYHLLPVKHNECKSAYGPECHFSRVGKTMCTERRHRCNPIYGAAHPAIFLTRDEYLAHIAKKLTA